MIVNFAYIIQLNLSKVYYLTNAAHNIVDTDKTYLASGDLLKGAPVERSWVMKTSDATISLSGANGQWLSEVQTRDPINSEVTISVAYLNDDGSVNYSEILQRGLIHEYQIKGSLTPTLELKISDQFANMEVVNSFRAMPEDLSRYGYTAGLFDYTKQLDIPLFWGKQQASSGLLKKWTGTQQTTTEGLDVSTNKDKHSLPLPVVYGEQVVDGTIIYQMVGDQDGGNKVDNENYFAIVLWSIGHCDSIEQVYFSDLLPLKFIQGGDKDQRFDIEHHMGDGAVDVPAFFDTQSNAGIVSAIDGRTCGMCFSYIKLSKRQQLDSFPNGVPKLSAHLKGRIVWSGNKSEFSDNPVWQAYNYLTNDIYGKDLEPDEVDYLSFVSAAEQVQGTFSTGFSINTADKITDNIKQILETCLCTLTYINGRWGIRHEVDVLQQPVEVGEDIVGQIQSKSIKRNNRYNQVSIEHNTLPTGREDVPASYVETEYYPLTGSAAYNTYLSEDSGFVNTKHYRRPAISDGDTAAHLAEVICRKSRLPGDISFKGSIDLWALHPGDVMEVIDPLRGWEAGFNNLYRVLTTRLDETLMVHITAAAHSPEIYDWAPIRNPTTPPQHELPDPGNLSAVTSLIFDPDDADPAFIGRLSWDENIYFEVNYRIEMKRLPDNRVLQLIETKNAFWDVPNYSQINVTYEFTVWAFNSYGTSPPASITTTVRTPPVVTGVGVILATATTINMSEIETSKPRVQGETFKFYYHDGGHQNPGVYVGSGETYGKGALAPNREYAYSITCSSEYGESQPPYSLTIRTESAQDNAINLEYRGWTGTPDLEPPLTQADQDWLDGVWLLPEMAGRAPVKHDRLILFNETVDPSRAKGFLHDSFTWEEATYIHGDLIVQNTINGSDIKADTRITVGSGETVGILNGNDGEDPGYRLWVGSEDPETADFAVTSAGKLIAKGAELGVPELDESNNLCPAPYSWDFENYNYGAGMWAGKGGQETGVSTQVFFGQPARYVKLGDSGTNELFFGPVYSNENQTFRWPRSSFVTVRFWVSQNAADGIPVSCAIWADTEAGNGSDGNFMYLEGTPGTEFVTTEDAWHQLTFTLDMSATGDHGGWETASRFNLAVRAGAGGYPNDELFVAAVEIFAASPQGNSNYPQELVVHGDALITGTLDADALNAASQLTVGSGASTTAISGRNTSYRIWAGGVTPAAANFKVTTGGDLHCESGYFNGTIYADKIVGDVVSAYEYTSPDATSSDFNGSNGVWFETIQIVNNRNYDRTLSVTLLVKGSLTADASSSRISRHWCRLSSSGYSDVVSEALPLSVGSAGGTVTDERLATVTYRVPAGVAMNIGIWSCCSSDGTANTTLTSGTTNDKWSAFLYKNGGDLGEPADKMIGI